MTRGWLLAFRCPLLVTTVLLVLAGGSSGCIDTPLPQPEPQARLVTMWDPRACSGMYRVVLELEDERGVPLSKSVPCELGGVTLDVPQWGVYRGRLYAWQLHEAAPPEIRSVVPVHLEIDAPLVHWYVETPR